MSRGERENKRDTPVLFPGGPSLSERLFCVTLVDPTYKWEAMHAAEERGEVRVVENIEKKH